MEDERGGVGPDISVGVSESPLSVNLPSEATVEKMGSEDQVEEPYEEGDGGEIMVEIVGSDVFVDGVSGDTEGDLGSEDVKDLEGHALENREETETQNISEAMDVSSGNDGNEMGESRNELDNVVEEKVEEKAVAAPTTEQVEETERIPMVITEEIVEPVTEKVDEVERTLIVINNEEIAGPVTEHVEEVEKAPMVINEEIVGSVMEPVEEVEKTPMVISEEKAIRHESVDKDNTDDLVKTVAVVEGKVGTAEKEESTVEQIEEAERTNVVISEEKVVKDEEVDKDSANVVKSEVVEGKNYVSEEQEIVPSNDAAANVQAAQIDSVAEVGSVNATEGGEVRNLSKDGGVEEENETTITDGDFGQETEPIDEREVKPVDEREVLAAESEDSVLKTDEHVSDVQEGIEEANDMNCEPTRGVDDEKSLPNITDFKGEESDIILPDVELESDLLHQNQEESTQLAEIEADTEGNQPTTAGEVTNNEKFFVSQVKVVDEEKGEEIDPETSIQSCTENAEILSVNASTESVHLSAEGTASQVEMADVKVAEDHVEYNDPIINAEVGLDNVLEEQVVTMQITETSNHAVDGVSVIDETCILPEITEKEELHVSTTDFSLVDNKSEEADNSCKNNGFYNEGHISETLMDVDEEREADREYHGEEDHVSEIENFKFEETINSATSFRMKQSGYLSPPEIEGHFSPSDLVWGKVRSHPWWPGQIFDPSEASEKAVKYHKKDSYLVAYFGDRTFAWNDAAVLKPFRSYFSQIEKQSNSEAFHNAVDSALEEVSRRVELGLACSCISKDEYSKIEAQVVENAGIREESSLRHGVDNSSKASHFEPEKLLEYITNLAPCASSGADRLDLVIAKAQLSAFCSFKGYRLPSEFPSSGELLENDEDTEQISDEMVDFDSHESKHIPKDGKERSLMEIMVDGEYSPDAEEDSVSLHSGKKRKAMESLQDGWDKRASIVPKPSFKIGECIRRVASQLTGSKDEMVISGSPKTENHSGRKSVFFSAESFSVDEMLSHLQLVAVDPKKGQNFQNNIRNFFMGFRSSIALNKRGRKKKAEPTVGGSGEEFEFDDVNDSYWTDRIVQNYSEEQLLQNTENAPEINNHYQIVSLDAEKAVKTTGRKPHSRKRYSMGNYPTEAMEIDESVKRKKQESSPAELILNFAERKSVPSEINLNKMFRRFGPLMESETEVDHETGRAKVIFKRGSDAEVAHNSAEKFNIFGPVLVNYQIGYSPVISVKISPLALPQFPEDATLMI